MSSPKSKFSLADGQRIADQIVSDLSPYCERIQIAGSIRRKRPLVGDVELLIIPKIQELLQAGEFFPTVQNITYVQIDRLIVSRYFAKRIKIDGTVTYGEKVRLLTHVETQFPIDLFFTTPACWYNLLVCRTGGKESNAMIARRALQRGSHWHMGGVGFLSHAGVHVVKSEEDVFKFVDLPFVPPEQRP